MNAPEITGARPVVPQPSQPAPETPRLSGTITSRRADYGTRLYEVPAQREIADSACLIAG